MTARDQLKDGWTVVLRRQPARIVNGHAEGPYPIIAGIVPTKTTSSCTTRPIPAYQAKTMTGYR